MTRKTYNVCDLVSLIVRLAGPWIEAVKIEVAAWRKARVVAEVVAPTVQPTVEPPATIPAVVVEIKSVPPTVRIPLVVLPAPITLPVVVLTSAPIKAPRRPATARTQRTAARVTTAPIAPQNASQEVLYRKAKRGDRYEVASNPQPGETLYRRVMVGKAKKYQALAETAAA
jgi:hypothetical protein